jgi:hypothetical protein
MATATTPCQHNWDAAGIHVMPPECKKLWIPGTSTFALPCISLVVYGGNLPFPREDPPGSG